MYNMSQQQKVQQNICPAIKMASSPEKIMKTQNDQKMKLTKSNSKEQYINTQNYLETQIFSSPDMEVNEIENKQLNLKKQLTIQEALQRVGTNGRYQILCNIFFFVQWFIAGAVLNSPIFLFLKPKFECDNGLYDIECENWACSQNDPLQFATYIPQSLVMEFNPPLICDQQVVADSIIAITYSGSIAGLLISSYISDNKGRKIASLIFWIIAGLGSILSGVLIQSVWLVTAGLFITTFGVNPVITNVFCFINEHSDGQFREQSSSLLNVFFAIGAIYLPITQYITDDWKYLQIYFIGIPILISNIFYYFIQEPPIFLYQKDSNQALKVLNQIASVNKKPKIQELELEVQNQEKENSIEKAQTYGYLDLFKHRTILITTICSSIVLFIIQFHIYGSNLTLSSIGLEVKVNTIITYGAEAISNLLTVYVIPKLSRRKNAFLMIASNIVFILFFFIKLPSDCSDFCSEKIVQTILMGIARFILGFQINIHQVYISELYPTSIRSIGIGFTSLIGVVGSIICGYFVTFFTVNNLNPIGSMGIAGILASLLYIPLKETLNKPLEDNISQKYVKTLTIPSSTNIPSEINIPTSPQARS